MCVCLYVCVKRLHLDSIREPAPPTPSPVIGEDRALNSSTECTTSFSLFLFGPTEHVAVTDPPLRATGCSSVCT